MTMPSQGGSHRADSTNSDIASTGREPEKGASAEEIEVDIDRTRHDLGETVEALAEKLDVKAQARRQVDEVKGRASNELDLARRRASGYLSQAKNAVTDERGKPNRNGWIGLSLAAAVVVGVIVMVVRSDR